jgi:hypothetical protein
MEIFTRWHIPFHRPFARQLCEILCAFSGSLQPVPQTEFSVRNGKASTKSPVIYLTRQTDTLMKFYRVFSRQTNSGIDQSNFMPILHFYSIFITAFDADK